MQIYKQFWKQSIKKTFRIPVLAYEDKIKTGRAESQDDSPFPEDAHRHILNKIHKMSKTNRKRTKIDKYNNPQQKHRHGTVSNELQGA